MHGFDSWPNNVQHLLFKNTAGNSPGFNQEMKGRRSVSWCNQLFYKRQPLQLAQRHQQGQGTVGTIIRRDLSESLSPRQHPPAQFGKPDEIHHIRFRQQVN
jgi:hypothetical protein